MRSGISAFLPLTIVLTHPPWAVARVRGERIRCSRSGRGSSASSIPVGPAARSALAGDGDGGDGGGTGRDQRRATGRERRARRDHVVDEQDPAAGDGPDVGAGTPQPERAGDVGRPLVAAQLELGDRRSAAFERARRPADRGVPRPPPRSAPPGRSRGGAHDRHGPGRGRRRSAPTPTRAHRRATAIPSGTASRCSPPYFSSCRARPDRTRVRGAPLELEERRRDVRRETDGRPGRQASRASSAGRQSAQSGAPSRPQPAHAGRQGQVEEAGREPAERRHATDGDRPRFTRTWRALGAPGRFEGDEVADGRPASLDRADRQLEHAVGAPHERHQPGPRPQPRVDRDHDRASSRAGSGRPRKTASIGNRMNIMWMPLLSVSQRPDPGSSEGRPMRPMNLAHRLSATSSRSPSSVARLRLRTRRATVVVRARPTRAGLRPSGSGRSG